MRKLILFLIIILNLVFPQDYQFPGDVNGDGQMDVLDVVALVDAIVNNYSLDLFQTVAADVNHDGSIDILDIVTLVGNIVSPSPCSPGFENCPDMPDQCCDADHPTAYTDCAGCHIMDYFNTTTPSHMDQFYPHTQCNICHTPIDWQDIIFYHTALDTSCNVCHLSQLQTANENVNLHNTLPNTCNGCHSTESWQDIQFPHGVTGFDLLGGHEQTGCETCHQSTWLGTGRNCAECHLDSWEAAVNPDHSVQVYDAEDCELCHDALGWSPSIYEHGLPLQTPCQSCHIADYEFAGSQIANHSQFSTTCDQCHQSTVWTDVTIEHTLENTGFELEGQHLQTACDQCHPDGTGSSGFVRSCEASDCHLSDYETSGEIHHYTSPSGGYPPEYCSQCHTADSWSNTIFQHDFPAQPSCETCHMVEFETAGTLVAGHDQFTTGCAACHQSTVWNDVTFTHSEENTGFELDGLHENLECAQCHPDGQGSSEIVRSCEAADCHLSDYSGAGEIHHFTTPPGGYPAEYCALCHNTVNSGFTPSVFDHNLTLAACADCHLYDYNLTTDPDHAASGYSETCDNCHETATWEGADPHQAPVADCTNCHNYNGADGDPLPDVDHTSAPKLGTAINNCDMCHLSTDNWLQVSFSGSRHDGSTYQIYFDIYSGDHNGEWNNNCLDNCHVFGDFDTFSCYQSCHEHEQADLLDEHCDGDCESCSGSNGYWNIGTVTYTNGSWTSPNTFSQCYSCHPDGSNDGPCGDDD